MLQQPSKLCFKSVRLHCLLFPVIQVVGQSMLTVLCINTNELLAVYFYCYYIITKNLCGQGETKMVVTPILTPPGARYVLNVTKHVRSCVLCQPSVIIVDLTSFIWILCPSNEVHDHQHPFLQDGDLTLKSLFKGMKPVQA